MADLAVLTHVVVLWVGRRHRVRIVVFAVMINVYTLPEWDTPS